MAIIKLSSRRRHLHKSDKPAKSRRGIWHVRKDRAEDQEFFEKLVRFGLLEENPFRGDKDTRLSLSLSLMEKWKGYVLVRQGKEKESERYLYPEEIEWSRQIDLSIPPEKANPQPVDIQDILMEAPRLSKITEKRERKRFSYLDSRWEDNSIVMPMAWHSFIYALAVKGRSLKDAKKYVSSSVSNALSKVHKAAGAAKRGKQTYLVCHYCGYQGEDKEEMPIPADYPDVAEWKDGWIYLNRGTGKSSYICPYCGERAYWATDFKTDSLDMRLGFEEDSASLMDVVSDKKTATPETLVMYQELYGDKDPSAVLKSRRYKRTVRKDKGTVVMGSAITSPRESKAGKKGDNLPKENSPVKGKETAQEGPSFVEALPPSLKEKVPSMPLVSPKGDVPFVWRKDREITVHDILEFLEISYKEERK